MHLDIISGIGIATMFSLGTASSLFNNEIIQFWFEQVSECIALGFWTIIPFRPPIMASPSPKDTMEWPKRGMGSVGPWNILKMKIFY